MRRSKHCCSRLRNKDLQIETEGQCVELRTAVVSQHVERGVFHIEVYEGVLHDAHEFHCDGAGMCAGDVF